MRKSILSACGVLWGLGLTPGFAEEVASPPFSAHVDLVSRYIVRGITSTYGNVLPGIGNRYADAPESGKLTLQWGADYVHPSGWFIGYWASQVNFSYKLVGQSFDQYAKTGIVTIDNYQDGRNSIENDFYGGYNGKLGDVGYTVGMTGYVYTNGRYANAWETKLGLSYQNLSLNAQTLLNDVVWGNRGDTYWTLNYTHALPYDISFTGSLGWFTYTKEGRYVGTQDPFTGNACASGQAFVVNACVAGGQPVSNAFRHLILGISQPIGSSGLNWGVQAIIGGENRWGVAQGERVTAYLNYTYR